MTGEISLPYWPDLSLGILQSINISQSFVYISQWFHFGAYDRVKKDDLLKCAGGWARFSLSLTATRMFAIWTSQLGVSWWRSCNVNLLVHILLVPHCLASEICQRGGARAVRRCRMSPPCIRLWCLSMCRGCYVTDTFTLTVTGGAASQTADCYSRVELNSAAYVVIGLVIMKGLMRQEETTTWFSGFCLPSSYLFNFKIT